MFFIMESFWRGVLGALTDMTVKSVPFFSSFSFSFRVVAFCKIVGPLVNGGGTLWQHDCSFVEFLCLFSKCSHTKSKVAL